MSISGSMTLNETLGGKWQQQGGFDRNANSGPSHGQAGPNASVRAQGFSNDSGVKGEAEVQASAAEYKDEKEDIEVHVGQVKAGASGEIGRGGFKGELEAKANLVNLKSPYAGANLGFGVSTKLEAGLGGVEAKAAGWGGAIGLEKLGISAFDNEVYINPREIGKTVWNGIKSIFS